MKHVPFWSVAATSLLLGVEEGYDLQNKAAGGAKEMRDVFDILSQGKVNTGFNNHINDGVGTLNNAISIIQIAGRVVSRTP